MDMGIRGRKAIVCAASKGLGKGCAMALAEEGVDLVINARTKSELEATAEEIRKKTGVKVTPIAVDVTTEAGRKQVLAACPEPDIIVNNAGGPPPGDFRDWNRDDWIKAIDANMLTPIEFIKASVDGMMKRGFGRIVNITSSSVKAPIDILGLSNGARSGLTGFVAGVARVTVRHQRPAAGAVRHRPAARHLSGARRQERQELRGGVQRRRQDASGRPLRHA
jgi:3-oxoacyl-[acyl-carrier protein] reductase